MINDRKIKRTVASWPEHQQIDFGERAAVFEYEGKHSREKAEQMAFEEVSGLNDRKLEKGKQLKLGLG
jgi:hypothetical protein